MRTILFILFLGLQASVFAGGFSVTLKPAPVDRAGLVLRLPPSAGRPDEGWLRDEAGRALALQRDAEGALVAVAGWVPAHATIKWRLETGAAPRRGGVEIRTGLEGITASIAGAPVFVFRTARDLVPRADVPAGIRRAGYLHPVYSPAGAIVTDDYAANHPHHHGIWAPWTKTAYQGRAPDFWNMQKGTGAEHLKKVDRTWSGPVHGGLEAELHQLDLTGMGPIHVLTSRWTVVAYDVESSIRPMRLFDLRLEQRCAGAEPLELPEYHYGGFGLRGAAAWNGPGEAARFLTSEGVTDRKAGNGTRARWCYLGGRLGEGTAGTAVLCAPDNYRAPQPVRLHPDMPYFSYVPQQLGAFSIKPGESYRAHFRFVVTDGEPDATLFEACWQALANPAALEIAEVP